MEGIINLESIFEDELGEEEHQIISYEFDKLKMAVKTRKLHIGISRSVWKASVAMSHYLLNNSYLLENV